MHPMRPSFAVLLTVSPLPLLWHLTPFNSAPSPRIKTLRRCGCVAAARPRLTQPDGKPRTDLRPHPHPIPSYRRSATGDALEQLAASGGARPRGVSTANLPSRVPPH
eukprot:1196970-Pleurochrysis_carterae.AAC.1